MATLRSSDKELNGGREEGRLREEEAIKSLRPAVRAQHN